MDGIGGQAAPPPQEGPLVVGRRHAQEPRCRITRFSMPTSYVIIIIIIIYFLFMFLFFTIRTKQLHQVRKRVCQREGGEREQLP